MKKYVYLVILILLCLFPHNTKAFCSSEEKARLKKIISNINISYDYRIVENDAIFSIKFNNLTPDIYFKEPNGNYNKIFDLEHSEIILDNYDDGKSYMFSFYGSNNCGGINIGNLYVTTPSYNPYYLMSVCNNAKEFELCQKWASHSLTRSQFMKKVEEYKEKKGIIDDSKVKKEISFIDLTFSFIRMYGVYIIIAVAVIIFIIKFIRYKKDTFGF